MIWGDLSYYLLFIWLGFTLMGYLIKKKELVAIGGLFAIYLGLGVLLTEDVLLALMAVLIGFYEVWTIFDET